METIFEHEDCFFEDTIKTLFSIMETSVGCSYYREELDELTKDVQILNRHMKQYLENSGDREREGQVMDEKEQLQFGCRLLSEIQWTLSEIWDLQKEFFQSIESNNN